SIESATATRASALRRGGRAAQSGAAVAAALTISSTRADDVSVISPSLPWRVPRDDLLLGLHFSIEPSGRPTSLSRVVDTLCTVRRILAKIMHHLTTDV